MAFAPRELCRELLNVCLGKQCVPWYRQRALEPNLWAGMGDYVRVSVTCPRSPRLWAGRSAGGWLAMCTYPCCRLRRGDPWDSLAFKTCLSAHAWDDGHHSHAIQSESGRSQRLPELYLPRENTRVMCAWKTDWTGLGCFPPHDQGHQWITVSRMGSRVCFLQDRIGLVCIVNFGGALIYAHTTCYQTRYVSLPLVSSNSKLYGTLSSVKTLTRC